MLSSDYLSTSSGGQISLSSPSMPFSQLASPWVTPHCTYPAKLLVYGNIAHPSSARNTHTHFELKKKKKAVALVTYRSDPSPLCWCQGFLWLMLVLHFCYISCRFEPYWLNYTKGIRPSFLFLESASGNFRVSVKVFLWWYLSYEGTYNTYRSFRWQWAMWIYWYSNAQCPCFNLCSNVCIHFSLTSLHFQSSILTCAACMT